MGSTHPSSPKQPPEPPGESAAASSHVPELEAKLVDSVVKRTQILCLPALLPVIDQALRANRDPAGAQSVVDWLALEPSLALRVLDATAGKTPTCPERRPAGLEPRVAALGQAFVRTILLSAARASVAARRLPIPVEALVGYWSHSTFSAFIARALAEAAAYESPEEAHLAGLLHDLGSLMLLTAVPHTFQSLVGEKTIAGAGGIPEQAGRLGTIHAEIGARFLDGLDLPFYFRDAILLHHAPAVELAGTHPLVRIVRSAESLSRQPASECKRGLAADLMGIPMASVQAALARAGREFEATLRTLGLATATPPAGQDEDVISESILETRALTDTLVGRVVEEAGRWAEQVPAEPGRPARMPDEPPVTPAMTAPATEAMGASLLEEVLEEMVRLEATVALQALDDVPRSLAEASPLFTALAGVKRFLLFAPAEDDETAWPGWRVDAGQTRRFELSLPLSLAQSIVARAAREGTTVVSYEAGSVRRLVGLDLQIARALGAEAIAVVPLKAAGPAARGVLVLPVLPQQVGGFEQALPLLEDVARRIAAAAERERRGARAGSDPKGQSAVEAQQSSLRLIHEARRLLCAIQASLETARHGASAGENLGKALEGVGRDIDRLAQLLERIGEPGKKIVPEPEPVDLNRLVEECLRVHRDGLFTRHRIQVELNLDEHLPPVLADAGMLRQVLLELMKNASEAMTDGGRLRVATADLVNHEGAMMVEVTVADTGPGMPPEKVATLFSLPGAAPSGQGEGLADCLALVKTMGGHLTCHSRLGLGTTFRILLPRRVQDDGKRLSSPAVP